MIVVVVGEEEQEEISMLPSFTPPRRQCSFSLRRLIIPSSCKRIFFWPLPARDRVAEILIASFPFLVRSTLSRNSVTARTNTQREYILATEEDTRTRSRRGIYYLARAKQSRPGNRILFAIFGTVSAPLATCLLV